VSQRDLSANSRGTPNREVLSHEEHPLTLPHARPVRAPLLRSPLRVRGQHRLQTWSTLALLQSPRIAQRDCRRANPDLRSESRSEPDVEPVREGRNSGMESKKGRIEEQPGKKAMRLHSDKQACPRRRNPTAVKTVLSCRQTERDGKAFRDAEQSDCHLTRCWDSRIASEPLCPREARVGTLRAGQDHFRFTWRRCDGRRQVHLDALVSHELHTGAPVFSPAPIPRSRSGAGPTRSGCSRTLIRRGFVVASPCH
jgi:hypothetical protein